MFAEVLAMVKQAVPSVHDVMNLGILPIYGQTNFALYGEAIVSSNDSCGLQGNDEFCLAVDRLQRCNQFDYCNARCPFGDDIPFSVDLVATGTIHGEAGFVNQSSEICTEQGERTIQLNGTDGFISKSPEVFNESQGFTLTIHLSQTSGNKGIVARKEDNTSLVFAVSADSNNQQMSLEYLNASGSRSIQHVNSSLTDGQCHHMAVVLFSSTIQLYVDTVLVAEEVTYQNLWNQSGSIFLGGMPNVSQDQFFEGVLGSAHLYAGPLLPSEISADATGQNPHKPRVAPRCRCHVEYPLVSSNVYGLNCVNPKNNETVRRVNVKAHFAGMANDGNLDTWWQSKRARAPLNFTVSLGGVKQVLVVKISFKWWPPASLILLKSADYGSTWLPWQYFAQDCRATFGKKNRGKLDFPNSVNCIEEFSYPVQGETVPFYLLQPTRPAANSFKSNATLQEFSLATHVRLSMVSHLGNSQEKTDYFSISEIKVYGRNCSCPFSRNISSCQCDGDIVRPPKCNETLKFDSERYTRSIFDQTPIGVPILQVHVRSLCDRSSPVSYSIIERNDSGSFQIENTTGVFKLRSYVSLNSTFQFLVEARLQNDEHPVNTSTALVLIQVVARDTLSSRAIVNFEIEKLGFLQDERISNLAQQFGFFVNGYPGSEGSLRAFVRGVSADMNYTTSREQAKYVKAVLINTDVYWDRPAVRIIAQVQDSSYNVRTLVDDSEVVVKVVPSVNLSVIDGSLLQRMAKPSASSGIAEIQVPLPPKWFSDPSLVGPEVITITYRLRNSASPPTLLGDATIHPQDNPQLFPNDVYGVLPLESVFVGGTFSFSIYCDSSYAVASFGIRLAVGPSLVIVASQIDGQQWVHVAVNQSSSEWVVSATLTDPEAAPQGFVGEARLVSFEVKVKEMAVADTNATVTAEVAYLSNINNEEIEIGGQSLPVMAAMIDGFSYVRHTLGTIRIASNDITQLIPYAEPSELVNTAVINGQIVMANVKLLAVQRSGDVTTLSEANCTSLSRALQVTKNCSSIFLNGSEPEGSLEARVQVEYDRVLAIVSIRVWFPVLPLNLSLNYPELAQVTGWIEFDASSGNCAQRYQWSEVYSEALFTYDGIHFENISTTHLIRGILSSLNESVAVVDGFGNVHGMSPGRATITAVNPLTGIFLGSADVIVTSLTRVAVQVIDIVMVTNLSVSIPTSPYPRLSTQIAVASVHQDLRRDHTRGSLVACVSFSDGRRQKLNSELGLQLKSLDDHVLRIIGQSEAISVGSGAGMLQADWALPASVCYPSGFSLGVGYEMTNVSLSPPIELEITDVSPQIAVPGDSSTVAGIPTSSPIVVTLVFENDYRVDMSSDPRTVYDLSKSDDFFVVHRDHNNVPMIKPSSLGKGGRKDLVVRFTHFAISGSVSVNIITYVGLALNAKPYPFYSGSPSINSLSRIADTGSYEIASLNLVMVLSDSSSYDITPHELTSFSSRSSDVIVGQKAANRVTVKSVVTSTSAILYGVFSGVGSADLLMNVHSSPVNVANITDFVLVPENNRTLSGVQNSQVAQVQLSLTFNNGRQVLKFYEGSSALFPGLITLTSENIQVFSMDSSTGQITLRRNYHQTLSITATAAVSMVTSKATVACNLLPAIGDVDLGEHTGLPLPPRSVGSLIRIQARLNAGGVKIIDLTLSYDKSKLALVSAIKGRDWTTCVPDHSTIGQISLDCSSDSSLNGLVEVAVISFNATNPGLAAILGSVTTDILGTSSLVAGDVDQEIIGSGKRRRRSVDDRDRRDLLEGHKRRLRRSVFCASPPCQCDEPLLPGDVNRDCLFDLGDVIFVLRFYSLSVFNFANDAGSLLVQSVTSNQSRDLDVDRNTVVNPADAFYLVRALLGLVRFVSVARVTPVQLISSDCQLSFSVTLMSKNGLASDTDTFVFFDITYRGSAIDFAGSTASPRGVAIYGNVIRGISRGNGSFSVQAPFDLVQNSLGLSVFHVTLDSNNGTSFQRLSALLGSPRPPYLFPFKLSADLNIPGQIVSFNANNNYNPFVMFNNTLSSADCVNNFTPQFEMLYYRANVSENATINSSIITVNATDLDQGDSGRISYSLVSDDALPFAVNSTSGVIRNVRPLDREEKASYNLTVRATDGGAPGREKFTHAFVFVTIFDVNDNAPVVTKIVPGHVIKIPENALIGSPLARVIASDADIGENARLSFGIVQNSSWNGTFVMNATTGEVVLNSSLHGKVDDVFKVTVLISDHGVPVLTVNTTVEFWVTYASDVKIFFISQFYEANLTENSAENTSVVQVTAYVPGLPSAEIVYSISENDAFKIDSDNGIVSVNSTIDREANEFFSLTVTSQYGQNISANATVNITVLDQNDNAPIPYPVTQRVIPYNLPAGSEVWRVNASDEDIGRNAALQFYLFQDAFGIFAINRGSGVIFLNSSLLDLNESFIQLSIEVSDSGVPSLSANLTVNISVLFPPQFDHSSINISIPEDVLIDKILYTFTPRNISGQDLHTYFAITDGNFGDKFSIRNLTGEVLIQASLDREEVRFYSLSLHAWNLAVERFAEIQPTELSLNITVLDINDNAPYLEVVKPITIKNTAHVGYTLVRVNATDSDEGLNAQLQFKITSGNELNKFVIDNLGFVQLNKSLLFDSVAGFFLTINVTDLGSPILYNTTGINVTVQEDRSPPHFNHTFYNASILEDVLPGSEVVMVFATDPNGDRIFYNISSAFANVASIFKVNSSTGIVTTLTKLDREIRDTYRFEINACKYSPLTGQKYFDNATIYLRILDVNDEQPRFEQSVYTVEMDEGNPPGVFLMSVHANDSDQGLNSLLSYTIISGNESVFSINSSSGEITVLLSLDFETLHQLNLTVQAKDHGIPPLEANASVVINIRDINDNAPIIENNSTNNLTLLESVPEGTFVVQINASDADRGMNSNLTFSVAGGNAFTINPANGIITTASELDYEKEKFYILNVSVRDQGTPPLSSSILVKIEVIDVNDGTPVIYPLSPVYVRENVPVDTVITRVNATDGDSGINAVLNFTLVSGNQAGDFIINVTSGVIATAHSLDHENVSSYILNVSVTDNGDPPLTSNAVLVVYVIDVNDHRPIFSQELYQASVYENFTVNSTILRVHARDLDSSSAGGIVYSLHEGNDNDTFLLNSSSGEIKLARSLDFEETKHYLLVVKATDTFLTNDTLDVIGAANDSNSSISFFSFANVSLTVLDVNDNPPRFARDFYSVSITENLPTGSFVARVHATDKDSGENGGIVYELLPSGLATKLFVVNGSSGEIRTKFSLRDANYLTIALSIIALDRGTPALNNTSILQVRIHYNVTFKFNDTNPFTFVVRGAFPLEQPVMLSSVHAQANLGLFSRMSGEFQVSTGKIQRSEKFKVLKEHALYIKAALVSDWSDYQVIRIAVQIFDENFNVKTTPTKVYFKLVNLNTDLEVNITCVPSINSGICVGRLLVPQEWLNSTVSPHKASVQYGLLPSKMVELKQVTLSGRQIPRIQGNFLILTPLYLLNVGDEFLLEVYAQYPRLVKYYTLIFTVSTGLKINDVQASPSWSVQKTFNGANEFVVFGARKDDPSEDILGSIALYFTIKVEIAVNAIVMSPETMECIVSQVSDQEGNELLDAPVKAVFEDRRGRNDIGHFVVVQDNITALFVVPDFSVVVNTAVLNGIRIDVPLVVYGVTASGKVLNVTSVTCRSLYVDVLKVSNDCSSVFVDGTETSGSTQAIIEFSHEFLTSNSSFIVWAPTVPINVSVTPAKLKRVRDWYDPSDSCKSRFQHARVTVKAEFSNGKQSHAGVDVTQYVKNNLKSSNVNVAEIVGLNVHGKSVGNSSIVVYNSRLVQSLGVFVLKVSNEETRVYVLDTLIATRLFVKLPESLNSSLQHTARVHIDQKFSIPKDQGSVIIFVQYSDEVVNTFDSLHGFYVNSTNNGVITVQGALITAVNNGNGNLLHVVMHSGHCTPQPAVMSRANVDINFQEPIAVLLTLSSREITPRGDPAEAIGVPLSTELTVTLLYNISGREHRIDVTNDSSTVFKLEIGANLADVVATERARVVSASGAGFGQVEMSIKFAHVQMSARVAIDVIGVQELITYASPHPAFKSSSDVNLTQLNPIGSSGEHQQARLNLILVLTNGTSIDISRDPRTRFEIRASQPAELAQNSLIKVSNTGFHVVSVQWRKEKGQLSVNASFMGFSSHVLTLEVESTPVTVTGVEIAMPPNFTLTGLRDRSTLQLVVNLEFSDSSKILGLFSSENLTMFDLVLFSSQDTTKISLNETSGLVTLQANSPQDVSVTVYSIQSPSLRDSFTFTCNLDPDVGDVDIGDVTGVPLKPVQIGESFVAPVRINSGDLVLGSFDVEVVYNSELLEVVGVNEGADMTGFFVSDRSSQTGQTGKVRIAGALTIESQDYPVRHVADVKFRVISSGFARVSGTVLMIAADDLVGSVIGSPVPRSSVVGDVEIAIGNNLGRLRRSLSSLPLLQPEPAVNPRTRRSVVACASPPCSNCTNGKREPGDTDGNCIFDIRDVKFALTYMTEQQFNFSRDKGQRMQNNITQQQLQALDVNGDGSVTLNDVNVLLRANLQIVSLFPSFTVVPVQDPMSNCLLTISVSASQLGIEPFDANGTIIFFDVSHSESDFTNSLRDSVFITGTLDTTEKGIPGGIIRARYNIVERRFVASLNTSLLYSSIGLSFVQVRFANDGLLDFTRTMMVNGLFSRPPLYQGVLNATLDLGRGRRRYSITRPNGYNPYTFFSNALASSNCSDDPLLQNDLVVGALGARKLEVSWRLANVRRGLIFSFTLKLRVCDPAQINEACEFRAFQVSGTNHTVTGLQPYTNYSVKVETTGLPLRETRWEDVRTLEAVPEGVSPPVLEVSSSSSLNASWTQPQNPNGVIISYSLHMRNLSIYSVLYQGSSLSYHVTGLSAGQEYFFFIMANTSVGGNKSEIVSASVPLENTPTSGAGGTDLSIEAIVGITIGSAAFITLLIILLVWLVRRHVNGKQPSSLDYQSLQKYNSLGVDGRENLAMQLRSTSSLRETSLARGRMYEHHFSMGGLENPWKEQDLEDDPGQDSLAMVNHRHFEPGSARTQNWDPGYEETVLKEAAEEMNELDAAMKENADTLSGLTGQQFSLREDNLVNMSRLSRSQSSLSPENTSKKKSKKKKEDASIEWDYYYARSALTDGDQFGIEETKSRAQIRKTRVVVEEMLQRLASGDVNKEFRELAAEKTEGTYLCANDPANLPKNRYKNILPFDHSRVSLEVEQGQEDGDYINANFLNGFNQKNSYIATQGPLNSTIADFWQMIWEQNVHVIVMLTRLQEGKKVKCVKYWPDTDEEVTFRDFVITSTYKRKLDSRVVRRFLLENSGSGECRELMYFQFTAWPDFGIPSSPADFLELYYEVMREYKSLPVPGTPILVHCSAGVGRSGAFCAIQNCLQSFRSTGKIDVAEVVRDLRRQRSGMVQTLEQYAFCYKSLVLALLYQIKLKKLKGISLLSQSAATSSGVWMSTAGSFSPRESVSSQSRLQSPGSGTSQESVTSQNAPPYSYSQQLLPPVNEPYEDPHEKSDKDDLPTVVVHSTPKLSKQDSLPLTLHESNHEGPISTDVSLGDQRNLEVSVEETGRRKTTGNIRRRPDLGKPPPPPPPPPPPAPPPPSMLRNENVIVDGDLVPELPEVDYPDSEQSDDEPYPPPPEAFYLPFEAEQPNQFDSSA